MTLKNIHRSAAIISFICLGLLKTQDTPSQNRLSIAAETGGSQVTLNALQQKRADSGAVNAQGGALAVLSQAEVNSVVQQLESAYVSAYNRGDAKAAAELYTEGATVLGEFGALRQGREDIHTTLSFAFAQTARPRIEDTTRQSAAI